MCPGVTRTIQLRDYVINMISDARQCEEESPYLTSNTITRHVGMRKSELLSTRSSLASISLSSVIGSEGGEVTSTGCGVDSTEPVSRSCCVTCIAFFSLRTLSMFAQSFIAWLSVLGLEVS